MMCPYHRCGIPLLAKIFLCQDRRSCPAFLNRRTTSTTLCNYISHSTNMKQLYKKLLCEIVKPSGGSHARHRFSDMSLKSGDNHFQIALPASPTNYLVILSQPFCGFGQLPGATVYQNLSTL